MNQYSEKIAQKLMLDAKKVDNTISLLENSCTIAFIARYRKEVTGGLDEVQISLIVNALKKVVVFKY